MQGQETSEAADLLYGCCVWRIGCSLALVALLASSACGSDHKAASARASVTVFAAASLTESFGDLQVALDASDPGLSITYSFGGSGSLVTQVQQGAPADVVATADPASMTKLVDAPTTFARNKLEILVAPGNPMHINTLADLARIDVLVVLGEDTVPAGKYAAQVLSSAGVEVDPVSKEPDVKSAVSKVTSGEADATVVYVTDVRAAGSKAEGVEIPDAQNVVAEYPIAIVKGSPHRDAAAAFVDAVVKGRGQAVLHEHGFLAA
jgi:molybdate transport system substrate-binding protein